MIAIAPAIRQLKNKTKTPQSIISTYQCYVVSTHRRILMWLTPVPMYTHTVALAATSLQRHGILCWCCWKCSGGARRCGRWRSGRRCSSALFGSRATKVPLVQRFHPGWHIICKTTAATTHITFIFHRCRVGGRQGSSTGCRSFATTFDATRKRLGHVFGVVTPVVMCYNVTGVVRV